ncbi:YoaK family protein [Pseudoduganella sp. RAF19]|uniref:YoaK family protein n=1 Tax=Pseudoduganella sp. RAF19 TaxID=3233052 RepID=UPI003F9826E9
MPEPRPLQGASLGFIAGYVDTLGFIGLAGLFTAHVTGNFVMIGRTIVDPTQDLLMKLLVFPVFILAVMMTRVLVASWQAGGKPALRNAMLLQFFLLLGCMVLGWATGARTAFDSPLVVLTGMLGAAGMAVQNAYGKLLQGKEDATTVMTGNVTMMSIALVDAMRGDAEAQARARRLAGPICGFGVGAISGALAWKFASFLGLLPVIVLLAVLAWQAGRREAQGATAAQRAG